MKLKSAHKSKLLAISIRQPYVEQIFRKIKKVEYRGRKTSVTGRVYVYASLKSGDMSGCKRLKIAPEKLVTGKIVGTVEIIGCSSSRRYKGQYEWALANPKRLKNPFKPKRQPQPVWFYPY